MNGDNVCERERERVATVRPGDSEPVPVSGEERCQLPGKTVREQDSREAGPGSDWAGGDSDSYKTKNGTVAYIMFRKS